MSKIIITSDIHVQQNNPVARTDNYLEALGKKLGWLDDLHFKLKAPIVDAGDLLNSWKLDPEMEQWCVDHLPEVHTVIGNHDMKNHNINLWKKGSLSLLHKVGQIRVINNYLDDIAVGVRVHAWHYGQEIPDFIISPDKTNVLVIHTMVCQKKQNHNHFTYEQGRTLLRNNPYMDLIISGHNHESFQCELNGRLLLNPGSLMRRDATQKNYQPRVFVWNSASNEIEAIDVPCEPNVISDAHLVTEKERNEKLEAFVESLALIKGKGLNYKNNLELYIEANAFSKEFVNLIWQFVD